MLLSIVSRFGLPAVFVGSGVEGEPFAIAGGLLAHQAIVPLWAAVPAAILGAFTIDLFWFMIGRFCRSHRWVQATMRRPAFARSLALIERHSAMAVPLIRFAYGLRAVAPIAVGTSAIPTWRFIALDLAAATAWGTIFTLVGYGFGAAIGPWAGIAAATGAVVGLSLLIGNIVRKPH